MHTRKRTRRGVVALTVAVAASVLALVSASAETNSPAAVATPAAISGVQAVPAENPDGTLNAADLQEAYRLPSDRLGGQTIAVIVPYNNPSAGSDLAQYRSFNELPVCGAAHGCLRVINQRGGTEPPPTNTQWSLNSMVGLELASAACPACKLLLVQADDETMANMAASVDQAVAQGADVVSLMYGYSEFEGQDQFRAHFDHPGVTITASVGSGFNTDGRGVVPAAYPSVIAVAGTELYRNPGTERGWTETVWRQTGSGCSLYEVKPSWQGRDGCGARRTMADVAAVAANSSQVRLYDSSNGGWVSVYGGPVASAFIAGVYGLAGHPSTTPAGERLYSRKNAAYRFDITFGTNGYCDAEPLCTAGPGYDGPSGMGAPNGTGAF